MAETNKWENNVGEICTAKSGKKYIKIKKDFTVFEGQRILLRKYSDNVNQMFERGVIKEDVKNEMLTKEWVSYVLNIPPLDIEVSKEAKKVPKRDQWLNECLNICQNGKGDFYIMVKKTFKVDAGDSIMLDRVDEKFKEMLENGVVTEEKYKRMLDSIKMKDDDGKVMDTKYWLHFRGTLPPPKK